MVSETGVFPEAAFNAEHHKRKAAVMKRGFLIGLAVVLVMVIGAAGMSVGIEETKEDLEIGTAVVTVSAFEGLVPAKLQSRPGTTVVWFNRSRIPAEILFRDKKVVVACRAPVNFFIGRDGAYESGKIISRGTASLCFTEKGSYDYVVKPSDTFYRAGEQEYRGTITIE
jgi:plastocyanin